MKNRSGTKRMLTLAVLVVALAGTVNAIFAANGAERPPNFVFIMADDMGYGDLGCYGHPSIDTPHLDRMADEGTRFTDFYVAASVCTPSRAALMTGRLPIRTGMAGDQAHRVLYPGSAGGLPPSEVTIARALKDSGYATACIGKWHLGDKPEYMPNSHGFDYFFGLPYSNDMQIAKGLNKTAWMAEYPDSNWWDVPLIRNEEIIEQPVKQNTLTQRYTEEAKRFIHDNRDRPFFLYLPHTFPHVPLLASDAFRDVSARGRYGDTIEEIDWSVGQVLEALRAEGLAENTLVFFTSDNGPWIVRDLVGGSAGLLRDGKGSTWEGGYRVPGIAWWPGRVPEGRVTHEIAGTMDMLPTFLGLAGAELPSDRVLDGEDITPVLLGTGSRRDNTVLYYRGDELYAVRKDQYKAHFVTWRGYSKEDAVKHNPPILVDLGRDPSEQHDVAERYPDVVAELVMLAHAHTATMEPGEPQIQRKE